MRDFKFMTEWRDARCASKIDDGVASEAENKSVDPCEAPYADFTLCDAE